MGCDHHPVSSEIVYLDGHSEFFIKIPQTRWHKHKYEFILALIFAVLCAIII